MRMTSASETDNKMIVVLLVAVKEKHHKLFCIIIISTFVNFVLLFLTANSIKSIILPLHGKRA